MEAATTDPLAILAGLLFTLVGPIKAMPTFYGLTMTMTTRARTLLALKAAALGAIGIGIAVAMGTFHIQKFGISREALGTATGLVLSIVGLMPLIGVEQLSASKSQDPPTALGLAFPTVVPPYAFGLIILISLYMPAGTAEYRIIAMGSALMAINAVAMIAAHYVLGRTGVTPLRLLGAVLGIMQLAFGIQMMFWGIANGMQNV